MASILNDPTKFKVCSEDYLKLVFRLEDKINRFLIHLKNIKVLDSNQYNNLFASGSNLGQLYGLPKIHKPDIPLRPILAAFSSSNFKLAKFLVPLLKPLASGNYDVNNSYDFVKNVLTKDAYGKYMVSFDIKSLFTNIPLQETIDLIICQLFPNDRSIFHGFSRSDFRKALELTALDSYFTFNDQIYLQCDGVAMGSPLGPIFANIFIANLERTLFKNCPNNFKPTYYCRYVDDTFALFKSKEQASNFLNYINSLHSNIHFTMECEENQHLSFLDVLVERCDSSFRTSVFRKKTFTNLGLNFFSFIPYNFKLNALRTLIFRGFHISSTFELFHKEMQFLRNFFEINGFPTDLFWRMVGRFLRDKYSPPFPVPTVRKLPFFISVPYLGHFNKILVKRLSSCLAKFYPYIDFKFVSNNPHKISNFFSCKGKVQPLFRSGVVYQYTCPKCNLGTYIGSTIRLLYVRICGHLGLSHRTRLPLSSPEFSAIRQHSLRCKSRINFSDFRILDFHNDSSSLRILESMHIKTRSPNLNLDSASITLHVF